MKPIAFALLGALFLAGAPAVDAADTAPAAPALIVPQADMERLLAAYALVKQNYVGEVDDKTLFDGALSGMLAALDAHSRYLDKDAMRDVVRENSGDYVGIGIEVEGDRDRLRVVAASDGSPAERAGIRPGDAIVAVDGTPVGGLANDDVARRMHGAAGTIVTIGIARGDKVETLHVTRAELHNDTVHVRMAAPGLAWPGSASRSSAAPRRPTWLRRSSTWMARTRRAA